MKNEIELTAEIEKQLRNSDWKFKQNVVIGAARPDFVVTTDKGDQVVIEVKAWDPSPENMKRSS
jgi:DNA-binding sugar fermentation-stimulating protein